MNHKHHTGSDGKQYLMLGVPEGAHMISYGEALNTIYYTDQEYNDKYQDLPIGNWQILGRSDELTEDQAAWIVAIHEETSYWDSIDQQMYVNYHKDAHHWYSSFSLAVMSLSSLTKSLGLDNPLILENISK